MPCVFGKRASSVPRVGRLNTVCRKLYGAAQTPAEDPIHIPVIVVTDSMTIGTHVPQTHTRGNALASAYNTVHVLPRQNHDRNVYPFLAHPHFR